MLKKVATLDLVFVKPNGDGHFTVRYITLVQFRGTQYDSANVWFVGGGVTEEESFGRPERVLARGGHDACTP